MLSVRAISKSVSFRSLFENITLTIQPGDRVGIIGPNGAGKSTFLNILAGTDTPDGGEIVADGNPSIARVAQDDLFPPGVTARRATIDHAIEGADARGHPIDEHEAEVIANIVLGKTGFPEELCVTDADKLSGGWRKRLSIACALARTGDEPDLLILDEPTNHLDLPGLIWLEELLVRLTTRRGAAIVFVTHDRDFLDRVSTRIAELSSAYAEGILTVTGDYTEFLRRKKEHLDAQAEQQRSLAAQVRKDLAWLSRGPQGRGTKAKGRIDDSHARMEALADHKARSAAAGRSGAGIDFNASARKTKKLIAAEGIALSLGGRPLFRDLNLVLGAGDRLGLLGPNGSGKTSLIRVLTGQLAPDAGAVTLSEPPPRVVVFSQHRETFDPQIRLREALCPIGQYVTFRDRSMHVTAWARRFLFADAQLEQPVATLSGGERARIHVARIMLQPSDVLILDEPTNDLDIPTIEVMEEALEDYPGALVLVTHDRAMLARLSESILALDGLGNARSLASIDQAIRAHRESAQGEAAEAKPERPKPAPQQKRSVKLSYNEQREYDRIESDIEQAERAVVESEAALQSDEALADHARMAELCEKLESAQAHLAHLFERWELLESKRSGDA